MRKRFQAWDTSARNAFMPPATIMHVGLVHRGGISGWIFGMQSAQSPRSMILKHDTSPKALQGRNLSVRSHRNGWKRLESLPNDWKSTVSDHRD